MFGNLFKKKVNCENCTFSNVDKDNDRYCSELGWHISIFDFEDIGKELHGRIYVCDDFGCNIGKRKK